MMSSLLKYQGKDGMWRELIDKMMRGRRAQARDVQLCDDYSVKHGWLNAKSMGRPARKSWIAVVGYVARTTM